MFINKILFIRIEDTLHLHGHVHSKSGFVGPELRYDVGVDNNNFAPISYKEVKYLINNR